MIQYLETVWEPKFVLNKEDALTVRRLLAHVAKDDSAYDLAGRLEDVYGELSNDDVFYYEVDPAMNEIYPSRR